MPTIVFSPSRAAAISQLRQLAPENSTIFTAVRHISEDGRRRSVAVYTVSEGGIVNISPLVANVISDVILMNVGGIVAVQVSETGVDVTDVVARRLAQVVYGNSQALRRQVI